MKRIINSDVSIPSRFLIIRSKKEIDQFHFWLCLRRNPVSLPTSSFYPFLIVAISFNLQIDITASNLGIYILLLILFIQIVL